MSKDKAINQVEELKNMMNSEEREDKNKEEKKIKEPKTRKLKKEDDEVQKKGRHFYIAENLDDWLNRAARKSGYTKSELVEKSIEFLKEYTEL